MPKWSKPALLVGTERGLHQLLPSARVLVPTSKITALATRGESVWLITDDRAVRRSRHGSAYKPLFEITDHRLTCLGLTSAGVFVGTSGAHLVRVKSRRLEMVHSFEDIPGRGDWFAPDSDEADTRSIAQGPDGAVFVNVHVGGVPRSRDGGRTWQPTIDAESDVHQVMAHPERPGVVLAAAAVGLCVSTDGGDTWTVRTDGLHGTYCRAVAVSGSTVLVTASTGPRTRRGALYRTTLDAGAPLEKCTEGLPEWFGSNLDTGCLAMRKERAAFGTKDGEVFLSQDRGQTWEHLETGLARVFGVAFAEPLTAPRRPARRRPVSLRRPVGPSRPRR